MCLLTANIKEEVEKSEYVPYSVYTENQRTVRTPLEAEKCMTGAYIEDENSYSDIKAFEEYTGISNDIYISIAKGGEDLPVSEITMCYAKGKIPMLIIEPDYGLTRTEAAARLCGELNIPMLVEIRGGCSIYTSLARLFREYAPKAVLVYAIEADSMDYSFPEEELVDWTAVECIEKMKDGAVISQYEEASRWCGYLKNKTVMLNISVPNFSLDRCNYAWREAADEITALYSLASEYNNIGALNYISQIEKKDNMVSCNYRITENILITAAYKKGVSSIVKNSYWIKTPYTAYVSDTNTIISRKAVQALHIKGKHINSGYSYINPNGFNKSERKVFVKS